MTGKDLTRQHLEFVECAISVKMDPQRLEKHDGPRDVWCFKLRGVIRNFHLRFHEGFVNYIDKDEMRRRKSTHINMGHI